ncbi:MAG: ABC transporter ATP-binding protein [Acidobacteria bacterium RIFCSPLOWO2_12_FULL_67_14b]|nr:MAG: ABC transporter ATP-binding protein [Acidobacteria bacterium RIFCSPLOWO2_12_FULL_67_14b]
MPETVAAVSHLTRSFGAKKALNEVSLSVPKGAVFGLVGENGAGKSTLIKHLLGLWRAETGSVRVFGLDPVSDTVAVLGRIGYLSEEPDLPGWMRVGELLRYTQAFYPRWDTAYAEQLRDRFALDPEARIKSLSKGQRARLGLLAAEAHRPDLLILDEPSSGLDPIVRRDILEAIIRSVTDEGRTVLFSSHLLDEVDRVSDHLAMLHRGTLRFCAPLEDIKARHRRISLHFERPPAEPPNVSAAIRVDGAGREWTVICDAGRIHAAALAQHLGATLVEDTAASLDEIFVAHAAH